MSSKNNVNSDHYRTAGRGRPWEGARGVRKGPRAKARAGANEVREGFLPGAAVRPASEARRAYLRRRQRLQRLAKLRGLSAKRLSERRRLLRHAGLG